MPKETSFEVNPEVLANIAGRILEIHAEVLASAEKMRDLKLESMVIGNYASLLVGMERFDIFVSGLKKRINQKRIERGDFSLNPAADPQPDTTTTKPKKQAKKKAE